MVTYSGLQQNVAGTDTNVGFFFGGFSSGNGNLTNVQVGWYAQGHDAAGPLTDALVTAIDTNSQTITIASPNVFKPGKSYIFSSERLTPVSNICFPRGTPVRTNQGTINIDEINPNIHTIRNKKIVAVTKTTSIDKYLVCFEPNSLGNNIPCERTLISKHHAIFFKGKPIKAKYFVGNVHNVKKVKYNGEVLYNILMEDYDKMMVNNLIVETLDPTNFIAKLYSNHYTFEERNDMAIQMNKSIKRK